MAEKLTEAQMRALSVLPFEITMWGGKPFAGLPDGIRNRSTLWALHRAGLATINYRGTTEIWRQTAAGRDALSTQTPETEP